MELPDIVRTIVVGGFVIERVDRQPSHVEVECYRFDMFGRRVPYLFAVAVNESIGDTVRRQLNRFAAAEQRILVSTAKRPSDEVLSWGQFCSALGGSVPSWRALGGEYATVLTTSARNKKPRGTSGEAWLTFEDSICDGLEYLFGFRVSRYGGRTRGKKVSDMVATLPEQKLLVVDAKATAGAFDASGGGLRALAEYVTTQKDRQRGEMPVSGSLVVSAAFKQDREALAAIAGDFVAQTAVPVTFCAADLLASIVEKLRKRPKVRVAVRWSRLFCRGGLLTSHVALGEINDAVVQRVGRQ